MRIVVTADGAGLDAPASSMFGRCHSYVFVDTETMEAESIENPATSSASGAGIAAAQFVIEQGAEAVVTGNVGPNAYSVLEASDVPVYVLDGGSVRDVVGAYRDGQLPTVGGATGPAHAGLGRGRGGGMGKGRRLSTSSRPVAGGGASKARQEEVSELKEMAAGLRSQLAEVIDRLDQLEKEE